MRSGAPRLARDSRSRLARRCCASSAVQPQPESSALHPGEDLLVVVDAEHDHPRHAAGGRLRDRLRRRAARRDGPRERHRQADARPRARHRLQRDGARRARLRCARRSTGRGRARRRCARRSSSRRNSRKIDLLLGRRDADAGIEHLDRDAPALAPAADEDAAATACTSRRSRRGCARTPRQELRIGIARRGCVGTTVSLRPLARACGAEIHRDAIEEVLDADGWRSALSAAGIEPRDVEHGAQDVLDRRRATRRDWRRAARHRRRRCARRARWRRGARR